MEFSQVLALVILFIGAPWTIFTGVAKVKASQARGALNGGELRMSELRRLIDTAVEEATEPLLARIETLEAIVTDEDPAAMGPAGRIDATVLDPALDTETPAPVRRTARS